MAADELYDDIADIYHLVYGNWEGTIRPHAEAFDRLLRRVLGPGAHRLLDVSCGVGTQALGLTELGHVVVGSDLSSRAIDRARREARDRSLDIDFSVADMRECDRHHEGTFDAVLSCDNAITHLMTDGEILEALGAFHRSTRPGGAVLVTVRDYAKETRATTPQIHPFGVRETPDGRVTVFQVWDWDETGTHYDFSIYFVRDRGDGQPDVRVSRSRYYAIDTDALSALLEQAGFRDVERIDGGYFQPVLIGRKPA